MGENLYNIGLGKGALVMAMKDKYLKEKMLME